MLDKRIRRALFDLANKVHCQQCSSTSLSIVEDARKTKPLSIPSTSRVNVMVLWRRYLFSVVTPWQKIDDDFWDQLMAQPLWKQLMAESYNRSPSVAQLRNMMKACGSRSPAKKAHAIHEALRKDLSFWTSMSAAVNRALKTGNERAFELEAVAAVSALKGCGVGPKVARLMLIYPDRPGCRPLCQNIVPIDQRWINYLTGYGCDLSGYNLKSKKMYLQLEDKIVAAAAEAGLTGVEADRLVFSGVQAFLAA